MRRSKGRENVKVAVQQYTKKDGTQVRAHERIVNPRFVVVCGDPYCKVVSSWDYDPLRDNGNLDCIVFTHEEAVNLAAYYNTLTPEQLVEQIDCTLEEAEWTPWSRTMKFKVDNPTDIPTPVIRRLVKFCMPENVSADFTLRVTGARRHETVFTVKDGDAVPAGVQLDRKGNNGVREGYTLYREKSSAYVGGRYYRDDPPHIVVRVSIDGYPTIITPYQYAQHKGVTVQVADRIEALVYILAHELRHLWQDRGKYQRAYIFPRGYAENARGKMSEVDTEAYAIHTLNRWREASKERVQQ